MSKAVLQDGLSREVFPLGETRTLQLGKIEPELDALPYWKLLPKDHIAILRFRVYVRRRCLQDAEFRASIMQACEEDIVFFANLFGWVFEPRPNPRHIPVRLWMDQANLLAILRKWYGRRPVYVGKSRGIGDSWCVAILYAHALRFVPAARMAVYSKDKDSVASDDDNSNLGKILYIINRLPWWLTHFPDGRPIIKAKKDDATIQALDNAATVQGFPATDNKSRGMRFTANWNDESNFWPGDAQAADNTAVHTCPNRMHVSTFQGTNTLFYHRMYREKTSALRVFHWWWANENRWRGAYKTEHGRIKILDESYKYPPGYEFTADGLLRSAYVDAVLRETGTTPSALEELYGVQGDANLRLFRTDTMELVNTTVRPPAREGYLRKKERKVEFVDVKGEKLKVWGQHTGTPRGGPYSVACDVSAGRGSAYSTIEVIDLATGEHVLEWADKHTDIITFAGIAYDVLIWLCGDKGHGHAYFTYDNGGEIGQSFGREILRKGYNNVMRRRYKFHQPEGNTQYYGLRVGKDGGLAWFVEMERAIRDGETTVRSDQILAEMHLFDKTEDERGRVQPLYPYREDGHGDRAYAYAMAWFQGRERREDAAEQMRVSIRPPFETPTDRATLFSEIFEPEGASRSNWKFSRT